MGLSLSSSTTSSSSSSSWIFAVFLVSFSCLSRRGVDAFLPCQPNCPEWSTVCGIDRPCINPDVYITNGTTTIAQQLLLMDDGGGPHPQALYTVPATTTSNSTTNSEGDKKKNAVLFVGKTDDEGQEPWVSDGTVEGTRLLLDIQPGRRGSVSRDTFRPFSLPKEEEEEGTTRIFFFATRKIINDENHGNGESTNGISGDQPDECIPKNPTKEFGQIYGTDLTTAGTKQVLTSDSFRPFGGGNVLPFAYKEDSIIYISYEQVFHDKIPNCVLSESPVLVRTKVSPHGQEEETEEFEVLLRLDNNDGDDDGQQDATASYYFEEVTKVNGLLVIHAVVENSDESSRRSTRIYLSDGTAEGTVLWIDAIQNSGRLHHNTNESCGGISAGGNSKSSIRVASCLEDQILFRGGDFDIWASGGILEQELVSFSPHRLFPSPNVKDQTFRSLDIASSPTNDGILFFATGRGVFPTTLWATDGSTQPWSVSNPKNSNGEGGDIDDTIPTPASPTEISRSGGFDYTSSSSLPSIMMTQSSSVGDFAGIITLGPVVGRSDQTFFVTRNHARSAVDQSGTQAWELWLTDGTATNTRMIATGLGPLGEFHVAPASASKGGGGGDSHGGAGRMVFLTGRNTHHNQIWSTDFTSEGTVLLVDFGWINGGGPGSCSSNVAWISENTILVRGRGPQSDSNTRSRDSLWTVKVPVSSASNSYGGQCASFAGVDLQGYHDNAGGNTSGAGTGCYYSSVGGFFMALSVVLSLAGGAVETVLA